jgi:hypothetical protein
MQVITTSRDWIITLKAEGTSWADIEKKFDAYRWVGQKEEGSETGYAHYQLAIMNDTPIRFITLKHKFPQIHLEVRRGTRRELYAYVTKEETRLEPPHFGGDWSDEDAILSVGDNQGKRTDLDALKQKVMDGASLQDIVLNEEPNIVARNLNYIKTLAFYRDKKAYGEQRTERESVFVSGASGVGKTRYVQDVFGFEDVFSVTDYQRDPFQGYDGQPVIFFDEFTGQIDDRQLTLFLGDAPVTLPSRFSNIMSKHQMTVMASNLTFPELYLGVRGELRLSIYRRISAIFIQRGHEMEDLEPVVFPKELFAKDPDEFRRFFHDYDPLTALPA